MTSAMPMFKESSGGSWDGTITPWLKDMLNRLVFVEPVAGSYDPNDTFGETVRPSIRANVLVLDAAHLGLDGGPLVFGGKGTSTEPATDRIGTPAFFQGVKISNDSIVKDLVKAEEERTSGTSGGWRVGIPVEGKGTKGNPPLHLGKVKIDQFGRQRPQADQLWAWAEQQFTAFLGGNLPLHAQSELLQPTPQASPDAHKRYQERLDARRAAAVAAGQLPPPPAPPAQPTYTTPAPTSQYAPGVAPSSPVSVPQPAPVAQPTYVQPSPQVTAQPANPDDAVPPGWDAAAWGNLDQAMRTMIWTQVRGAAVQPTH